MAAAAIKNGTLIEADAYSWRPGSRVKVDVDKALVAMRAIYAQHGAITPKAVVETSKPEDSVLHDEFEWDDTEAARIHREEQARYLLRSMVVVYKRQDGTKTQPVRAFVKIVPSADDPVLDELAADAVQPHIYLPIKKVMDEPDLRQRHRRQAWRELVAWRQRYRDIDAFATLFEQIDSMQAEMEKAI